ncbi:Glutamate-cysteine ligase catalytic subunit [Phytophthora palmivora]|uniref:Glutamate--cysteine ligase n=1 Tax=Phytophthora palmivora TaxID=4796 RepID=A0A2P4XF48_9STRA|nr:Glutamate-cysteine ligase catalytic subunit [Phytophthora palmivora]
MGLLVEGSPLDWPDALEWLQHVRTQGIDQFLHTYNRVKDIEGDELKWGDELEYGVFHMDKDSKRARLALRGAEILRQLQDKEKKSKEQGRDPGSPTAAVGPCVDGCNWVPEYGSWMIEGTPSAPYGGFTSDLRKVEGNMRLRRARLLALLNEDEIAPSVTAFPMMGVGDFTVPSSQPHGSVAMSDYVSDAIINPHPRFATLTRNIRQRRTCKVDIRVPIFQDVYTEARLEEEQATWNAEKSRPKYETKRNTPSSPHDSTNSYVSTPTSPSSTSNSEDNAESKSPSATLRKTVDSEPKSTRKISMVDDHKAEPYPGFIHMDAMAFGMGMCCLQVTFQAKNVGESRHLYDHLGVLSPILLALTAATPILKGRLADTDVRWATISAAVDDRTPQELGEAPAPTNPETKEKYAKMAGNGIKRLPKSRYEGISTFICNHKQGEDPHTLTDKYNDVDVPYDEESYKTLIDAGVDRLLALHISHLFIRDPLVIYKQRLHLDNERETDHFENIQSTNWQTVRWKPPPPVSSSAEGPHIGWRTEFRSMEIQLTDFENAAFTVFIALVSRVILTFDLNLYTPLSKVNENMEAAHRVNAVLDEKFHFRCHMAPPEVDDCGSQGSCHLHDDPDRCEPMTIAEIMLGKGSYFPGLIPLVYAYLDYIECDEATRTLVEKYMCLIAKRATGELPTAATWMRRFVRAHPDYRHDSVVPHSTAFDLLNECQQIGEGLKQCPELLGEFKIAPVRGEAAYRVPLKSSGIAAEKREALLQRYLGRTASNVCSTCHC